MIKLIDFKNIQIVLLTACFFCFAFSSFAEFVLDKKPCALCLVTRYSYLSFVVFLALSLKTSSSRLQKIIVCLMFGSVCFSLYHLGVENHWWAGPAKCSAKISTSMKDLMARSSVKCDVVNWKIFGISSTLYNLCFMAAIFWLYSLSFCLHCFARTTQIRD